MKEKFTRTNMIIATLLLALAAFFLRLSQLSFAFDENGMATGKGILFFSVITVLAVLSFGLYSRSLKSRKKYNAIAGNGVVEMALGAAAAFLMIVAGITLLLNRVQQGDKLLAFGSILVGLCWGATAAGRFFGTKIPAPLFMIPSAFYVVDLVCRFRFWTRDPLIIDYCYDLFALISIMCATFHLGGFCFDKGARRMTTFFCLCGVFFSAAAMVKTSAASVYGYMAAILWLFANLWLLLRPSRKREEEEIEEPAEEPAEPAEEADEPAETEEIAENEEEIEENEEIEESEGAGDLL